MRGFNRNTKRLLRAAKRTIRAEVTLVIVIVVIASWSVYALYKLALGGSDTLLGLKLTSAAEHNQPQAIQQHTQGQKQIPTNSTQLSGSITNPSASDNRNVHSIYSATRAAPTLFPQRGDQINNIQSLIANHNLNRLLLGNRLHPIQGNHPVAMTNPISSLIAPTTYDSNLIRHLASLQGNNGHHNGDHKILAARVAPPIGVNNHHERNDINLVAPMSPLRGRDFDYEESTSSDYEPSSTKTNLDNNSGDRQAEESSRDPGESVVEGSRAASSSDEEHDSNFTPESNVVQDASNESKDDDSQPVTTTLSPEVSDSDETNSDQVVGRDQSVFVDNTEEPVQDSEEAAPEDREEDPAPEEEESLKATGLNIDEEVDRMTQPSLGSISHQQDKPFNYKNTVQFDDSPIPSGETKSRKRIIPVATGTSVAQFADPVSNQGTKKRRVKSEDQDLQVDHNKVEMAGPAQPNLSPLSASIGEQKHSRKNDAERLSKTPSSGLKRNAPILHRRKRHLSKNIIRAPYEIDGFLVNLDIDSFIDQKSFEKPNNRKSSSRVRPDGSLQTAQSEAVGRKVGLARVKKKRKRRLPRNGPMRRSDEEDDDDSEAGEDGDEGDSGSGDTPDEHEESGTDDSSPTRLHRESGLQLDPRYHYITSNDTTLQDLLTRQNLLDALKNSQLPPPTFSGQSSESKLNQTGTAIATIGQQSSRLPQGADHQQAAGSLYSVDHGLLLYPASNEDHSSKSMSKKKKKHKKEKEKKKMTVAVKKGGHKKKKHKKEEKKFIKEKKFKGAKKGKKVSKGKGGQGGKKGKKLYKDKGFKKKGFKNVYHKEEFGQKKSYFDEFRDKDFKKKWKKFDDKYNYAQMKKWQAKDVKGAKKMKDHGEKFKKYDKGKWKKKYHKQMKEHSASSKKHKKSDGF